MTLFIAIMAFAFGLLLGNVLPQKGLTKKTFPRKGAEEDVLKDQDYNKL